jgi:hypothetical protein
MALENKFSITVDLKAKRFGGVVPSVTANDHVVFEITVMDDKTAFPLSSDYTYTLVTYRKNKPSVIRPGTYDAATGLVRFEIGSSETATAGKVEALVQILDNASNRVSSAPLSYNVVADPSVSGSLPADETTLVIANESLLTEAIDKANNADTRIDNIVGQTGSSNTEIVDARQKADGTNYTTLRGRLNAVDTSLADSATKINDMVYMTLTYSGIGTGVETTIAQAFPNVTLAQVQALDTTATLNDTADWYCLQKTIKDADTTKVKKVQIKQGTYKLSKPLTFKNNDLDVEYVMYGVKIKPATGFTDYLVTVVRWTERIYVRGLYIDGDYKANGLNLNWTQRFSFQDTYIGRCFTGLRIAECYSGSFIGTTFIEDCLTGLWLDGKEATVGKEVNTINFSGMKIGFNNDHTTFKQYFIPKNAGETDANYHNRVVSYGIKLQSAVALIKLWGVTIEGFDYGIKAFKVDDPNAFPVCYFTIEQCYFEYNWVRNIDFYPEMGYSNFKFDVNILRCRFEDSAQNKYADPFFYEIIFGYGNYTILENKRNAGGDYSIAIKQGATNKTTPAFSLITDVKTDKIYMPDTAAINDQVVKGTQVVKSTSKFYENTLNWQQYSPYTGTGLTTPNQYNVAPSMQDENYIAALSYLDEFSLAKYYQAYSPSNRDFVFMRPENGVVMKDSVNGKWYRLGVANGALTITEEVNTEKLFEKLRSKRIKWLERTIPATGEQHYCIEMKMNTYEKTGKWYVKPYPYISGKENLEIPLVGTGAEIAALDVSQLPTNDSNAKIWNKDVHYMYQWQASSGYWGFGAATMSDQPRTQLRAVGTTAQRPTGMSTGFIYYDTTTTSYVKWDGVAWVAYTPT